MIKVVWALLSAPEPDAPEIRKFENLGTRSFAAELAIGNAFDFQLMIGNKRKEERLRYLKNYWAEKAAKFPKVKFYTSLKPAYSCAIATFGIDGWQGPDMVSWLFDKKKIHTTNVVHENVNGMRVTPHVYTSLSDLDLLVEGIKEMSESEPPKKG